MTRLSIFLTTACNVAIFQPQQLRVPVHRMKTFVLSTVRNYAA